MKKPGKKSKKPRGGRPTVYNARFAEIAFELCKDGHFSARALAKKLKVSPKTIANWKVKHEDFADAIEKGKDIAVDDIEETYFNLAKGGLRTKKSEFEVGNVTSGDIEEEPEMEETKKIITTLAPNANVCNRILAAHRSEIYGDNVKLKHDVTEELTKLLKVIDGSSKGKLPRRAERKDARK